MSLPFGGEDILKPVATPDIPDPLQGSTAFEAALIRDKSTYIVEAMPWLLQNPSDEWAKELYDRIEEAEKVYAAPNLRLDDYKNGTASKADEIAVVRGNTDRPYVFSAEHATGPISVITHKYRGPDRGTGGLAAVLAEDFGTALIMRGRQTTNVPSVEDHPLKEQLSVELASAVGFISIHGKNPGMFVHQDDKAEIHACIGLGIEPSEAMREFAKKIVIAARDDLGLYTVISNNQPAYIQIPGSTKIKRNEDGSPKLSQLAALKPRMTTNFTNVYFRQIGKSAPSLQLELTDLLRLTTPEDSKKDKKSTIIGVALGYMLLEKIVELTFLETDLFAWNTGEYSG